MTKQHAVPGHLYGPPVPHIAFWFGSHYLGETRGHPTSHGLHDAGRRWRGALPTMKSSRATAGIPEVMLTAAFPLARDGRNAQLTKPVGVSELLTAIRSLLTSEASGPK